MQFANEAMEKESQTGPKTPRHAFLSLDTERDGEQERMKNKNEREREREREKQKQKRVRDRERERETERQKENARETSSVLTFCNDDTSSSSIRS